MFFFPREFASSAVYPVLMVACHALSKIKGAPVVFVPTIIPLGYAEVVKVVSFQFKVPFNSTKLKVFSHENCILRLCYITEASRILRCDVRPKFHVISSNNCCHLQGSPESIRFILWELFMSKHLLEIRPHC